MLCPSLHKQLFIHKSMEECFPGLKGQNILAQGIVSGGTIRNAALGKGCRKKNRQGECDVQIKYLFSDGIAKHHFRETECHL